MTSSEHDRRRVRLVVGVAGAGHAGGLAAAGLTAVGGGPPRAGVALLLAVTAAGLVAAGLLSALLAIVDEYRRVPVGRARIVLALGLFLGGAVLLVLSLGVVTAPI